MYLYLVYTRYIPGIYLGVDVGIYQVYTRYIPGLEITRYIPGIYLLYSSYIADIGLYPVYTRYIPGKSHFYRFQMNGLSQVVDGSWPMGQAKYRWNIFISAVSDWLLAYP